MVMLATIPDMQKRKVIFSPDGYRDRVRAHDRDLPCRNAVFTPGEPAIPGPVTYTRNSLVCGSVIHIQWVGGNINTNKSGTA